MEFGRAKGKETGLNGRERNATQMATLTQAIGNSGADRDREIIYKAEQSKKMPGE